MISLSQPSGAGGERDETNKEERNHTGVEMTQAHRDQGVLARRRRKILVSTRVVRWR